MLSSPKHLYRVSNLFTVAVGVLRQTQHDVLGFRYFLAIF